MTVRSTAGAPFRAIAISTVAVLVVDQLSKTLARAHLPLCTPEAGGCHAIGPESIVALARISNAGSALGFAQGLGVWVLLASFALVLVPLYLSSGTGRTGPTRALAVAAGLQLGGAVGNLLDRALFGGVTDFLVVADRVVINLADLALIAGTVLAALELDRAFRRRYAADGPTNQPTFTGEEDMP